MSWSEIGRFLIISIGIYATALTAVRIMGKRALGELSLFDLVIMAGIGDIIVVIGLEQRVPFLKGLAILVLIAVLELSLALITYHSKFLSKLLEGEPTILIKNGIIIEENLARERISASDLRQELRKQGVAKISQVSQAVLEACGKFSVILEEEKESVTNEELLEELTTVRAELRTLQETILKLKEK